MILSPKIRQSMRAPYRIALCHPNYFPSPHCCNQTKEQWPVVSNAMKLTGLQRLACLDITGAIRITPREALSFQLGSSRYGFRLQKNCPTLTAQPGMTFCSLFLIELCCAFPGFPFSCRMSKGS